MESGHGRLFTHASRRHQFHLRREGASLAGLLAGWLAGWQLWLAGGLAGWHVDSSNGSLYPGAERILENPVNSQRIPSNS